MGVGNCSASTNNMGTWNSYVCFRTFIQREQYSRCHKDKAKVWLFIQRLQTAVLLLGDSDNVQEDLFDIHSSIFGLIWNQHLSSSCFFASYYFAYNKLNKKTFPDRYFK